MDVNISSAAFIVFLEVLFVAGALVQLLFYIAFYGRLAFYRRETRALALPPVSVIIAARHEAANLTAHLPFILRQDYPDFEVVVVDDGSRDDTSDVLEAFQKDYPRLRIVKGIGDEHAQGGKKLALTLGIKAARHERLLFTDADCVPESSRWIRTAMEARDRESDLVLGYSPYARHRGLLNYLIRFETFYTAVNYLSFALAGKPYMGVGRNLSYTRADFFGVSGFKKHYSIASGDDDLFVNEVATHENTCISVDPEGHVQSLPKKTWSAWWNQKRRHLYTGRKYKTVHKFLLTLQPLSVILLWCAGIGLLIMNIWVYIVILTLSLRILMQFFIFKRISRWLGQADVVFSAALLEIVTIVMSGLLHIANATAKPKKWKN